MTPMTQTQDVDIMCQALSLDDEWRVDANQLTNSLGARMKNCWYDGWPERIMMGGGMRSVEYYYVMAADTKDLLLNNCAAEG